MPGAWCTRGLVCKVTVIHELNGCDLGKRRSGIFCREDWTGGIALVPQENFSFRRIRGCAC